MTITVVEELKVPGRLVLTPGREFTAHGVRGRLRFKQGVIPEDGEPWADGYDRDGRTRSIRISKIRKVHAKSKTKPPDQIKPRPPKGAERRKRGRQR